MLISCNRRITRSCMGTGNHSEHGPQHGPQRHFHHRHLASPLPLLRPTTPCQSHASTAAIITGTYASLAGLSLTLWPASTFSLLFPLTVPSGWIRVGGILFTLIGLQYLITGVLDRSLSQDQPIGAVSFYRSTVVSRLFLALMFGILVLIGEAPKSLLLLSMLNITGALSMQWALAKDARLQPSIVVS